MNASPAFAASVFFWPAFIASYAASATLFVFRERDYTACMEPRGYLITPWRANGESQVSKAQPEARMAP